MIVASYILLAVGFTMSLISMTIVGGNFKYLSVGIGFMWISIVMKALLC